MLEYLGLTTYCNGAPTGVDMSLSPGSIKIEKTENVLHIILFDLDAECLKLMIGQLRYALSQKSDHPDNDYYTWIKNIHNPNNSYDTMGTQFAKTE